MTSVTINYLFNLAARCNAIEKILRRKGLLDDKEFMLAVREEVEALQPMKNIVRENEIGSVQVKFEEATL